MQTLKIDEGKAFNLYPAASPEFKQMLEDIFGKEFFTRKITDRVKTFEDILSISGRTMQSLISPGDTEDEVAYKQAKLIAEVYREGVVLNAGDTKQYKYYPWHEVVKNIDKPSGFGLSFDDFDLWHSVSIVGVRLCFDTSEKAIDAGKKFIDIYEKLKIR